jgi:flagellar hook-basal body complex protein FliE
MCTGLKKERILNTPAIDSLLAQMRVAKAAAAGLREPEQAAQPGKLDFAAALKSALDGVAQSQASSEAMQKAFVMGDERASLSDTMIAMQKASINFQAAVQVRNKVVQAYNDIMNMQV